MTATRATARPELGRGAETGPRIQPALAAELKRGSWDYPWQLTPGLVAPVDDPGARHAASTLEAMVHGPVCDALAMGDVGRTVLNLACGEGRLAHEVLTWGARRVVGFDRESPRLRRARLLRDHFSLPVSVLQLYATTEPVERDVRDLGPFDVAVITETRGRLEGANAFVAAAGACTAGVLVVECAGPRFGPLAGELRAAGFLEVTRVAPPPDAERRYALDERVVLCGRKEPRR